MLNKITLSSLVILVTLFSGCSSEKEETVSTQTEQNMQSEPAKEETMAASEPVQEMASTTDTVVEAKAEVVVPELDNINFDFDKYVIRDDMKSVLSTNYEKIKDSTYSKSITLEGYCDERGTTEYNYALGLKRANSVKSKLEEHGVDASIIKVISYGEDRPLCNEQTEECWAKNRRVEFLLEK